MDVRIPPRSPSNIVFINQIIITSEHRVLEVSAAEAAASKSAALCLPQLLGVLGESCPITCTSSVQLVTLVTSFNASDFSH